MQPVPSLPGNPRGLEKQHSPIRHIIMSPSHLTVAVRATVERPDKRILHRVCKYYIFNTHIKYELNKYFTEFANANNS